MIFLVPLSWISFSLLDLTNSITGGLVDDLNVAIASLGGGALGFIASAFLGLVMILLFPIHWCLTYRPDDVLLIISVILPWVLTCTITSAISSHSPRGGLHTSLAIGIGYIIVGFAFYFILPMIINMFLPGSGAFASAILDGLSAGLTDLPYLLAVLLAVLEGCLVGSVFGAFIGSLKYKPAGGKAKVKKKEVIVEVEPTLDGTDYCTNCGAKVPPGVDFCTNCGSKINR